jgi:hypothetical protein
MNGQSSPIGIGQPETSSPDLSPKKPIFFDQVGDHFSVLAVQPIREDQKHHLERGGVDHERELKSRAGPLKTSARFWDRTGPRSPWQNPYVERVIGSMRRECLDHVIVIGEAHLRRILRAYLAYYHRSRTHLALGKDAPDGRVACSRAGRIVVAPEVGGLHHRYDRQAA